MWLFIATEMLMFGGLFCAYAVYRGNHPEIFAWGSQYLDVTWGFLNTLVLILSSFTMALAVRAAQCNQQRQLVLFLTLTLVCAVDFMAVKYIEYSHKFHEKLVWGADFYRGEHAASKFAAAVELVAGDEAKGLANYGASCAACHGPRGGGLDKLGPALTNNEFIRGLEDKALVAFLLAGRGLDDPTNRTGVMMPPKGGNPLFSAQDLMDVVAHLRGWQGDPGDAPLELAEAPAKEPVPVDDTPRSVIPLAAIGPAGLSTVAEEGIRAAGFLPVPVPMGADVPENAHVFFAIYFCMTGLHGLHVLVGIGVIAWLRARAVRGEFSGTYFTPVDMGGLYWHLVDIIWIFLFPLFYLI